MPGAPLILGVPAKLLQGNSAKGPWKAWGDPRPKQVTDMAHIKTDDPNDPRLASGEAKFWAWIR